MAEGERASSLASYERTNPIHEGSILMTQLPPKGTTSKYCPISGVRFQHMNLGGHKHFVHNSRQQNVYESFQA